MLKTYSITPTAGVGGIIMPDVPQTVDYDASQKFTVMPNIGYHITDVDVDGTSIGVVSAYTFTNVSANHTITAAFAINTYTLTPTAGVGGVITPDTPQTVNYSASQTFTITANANYHILDVGVDGTSVGAVSHYTFTNVTANHTITAAFAINTYTLTVNKAGTGSGTVFLSPNQANYPVGTVVTLTAVPDAILQTGINCAFSNSWNFKVNSVSKAALWVEWVCARQVLIAVLNAAKSA
jgi:hypothetical protein